ncbi:hypothetical protein HZ994_07955 [Akkermansiaceae bacterium]|nr:hypothetical protein HZ994_07955 [Akkermansiaceae bacterium]
MRILVFFLVAFSSASAQTDAGKLLADGLKQAVAGLAPVPVKDKAAVLAATTELLAKHITLRADGSASAYYTMSSTRRPMEWRKFVVTRIVIQPVSEADRLNGITQRYLVAFGSEAHRTWDLKTNTWGEWRPNGSVLFPAGISFEWKGGAWVARESTQLKYFVPGPGESVIRPERTGNDAGLPPGMSRGK